MALSSFTLVNESKTWKEAQRYCRGHYTDLASVRNQTENDLIKMTSKDQPTWIGLYRDSWKWSDGSPTSVLYWNTNEPSGSISSSCVILNEGHFADYDCGAKFYFICSNGELRLFSFNIITSNQCFTE